MCLGLESGGQLLAGFVLGGRLLLGDVDMDFLSAGILVQMLFCPFYLFLSFGVRGGVFSRGHGLYTLDFWFLAVSCCQRSIWGKGGASAFFRFFSFSYVA
jgi:hypothetical protein